MSNNEIGFFDESQVKETEPQAFKLEVVKNNYKFTTMSEIMSKPYPKRHICMKNSLPQREGDICVLSGRGGVGKGVRALISICEFLEEFPEERVLYWSTEDGGEALQERFNILIEKGYVTPENLKRMSMPDKIPVRVEGKSSAEHIKDVSEGFKYIIIDPLIMFMEGSENDNNDAANFMRPLNEYVRESRKLFLLIAHTSKEGLTARGAGAFEDNARLAYNLKTDGDGGIILTANKDNNGTLEQGYANLQTVWGKIGDSTFVQEGEQRDSDY